MMRVILVDDEQPALERLRGLLKKYPELDVIGEASDGLSALSLIAEKSPDIVFLDIDMPELNGLEVARTLGVQSPLVVFVTAYDQFALDAFDANAIDYVVKPVNPVRLELTVQKLTKLFAQQTKREALSEILTRLQAKLATLGTNESLAAQSRRLAVRVGNKYEVFDTNAISAVIARDHYTALIVNGRELLADDSLDSLLTRLDPGLFVRAHRSAALNVQFIKELKREGDRKYVAILNDVAKSEIQISRERLPMVKKFLGVVG